MKRVTFLLPQPIYEKLRLLAFKEHKSMSSLMRKLVEREIEDTQIGKDAKIQMVK